MLFDLDGTLIDPRPRLHGLFVELSPAPAIVPETYWALKRRQVTQSQLLATLYGLSPEEQATFRDRWMQRIEEPDRLQLDRPFPGVEPVLRRAAERAELYVVTARQHPERAHAQIESLGWGGLFAGILVTRQAVDKASLVRRELGALSPADWLVGDTGDDIVAGKALGLRTAAVLTGMLDRDTLAAYQPDQILGSIAEFDPDPRPGAADKET